MAINTKGRLLPGEMYVYHGLGGVTWLKARGWTVWVKITRRNDSLFDLLVWDELEEMTLFYGSVNASQESTLQLAIETLKIFAKLQGVRIINGGVKWPST